MIEEIHNKVLLVVLLHYNLNKIQQNKVIPILLILLELIILKLDTMLFINYKINTIIKIKLK